jgi:hypothetical protein
MYRVIEVARMLGVSKVTIYKKVNKNKKLLKNHIHTRSNITYIDDVGVQIIKETIEVSSSGLQNENNDISEIKSVVLEDLSRAIEILNHQIHVKKDQINIKDEIIDNYKTLIKSNRGKLQYLENKLNEVN